MDCGQRITNWAAKWVQLPPRQVARLKDMLFGGIEMVRLRIIPAYFVIGCALAILTSTHVVHAQTIDEAKARVEEAPDDPPRQYNLGLAYYINGRYADAITAFQEAIKLRTDYKEAFYNMGLAQQNTGKMAAAINSFTKAIELDGNYADAHAALGSAYRKNGQHSAASRAYKTALKLKPDNSDWHLNLGIIYQMMEDYANAVESYEAYLKYTTEKSSKNANQIRDLIPKLKEVRGK